MRKRTRSSAASILAILVLVALPSSAAAAAGDLDSSFSGDGKLTTNLVSGEDYAAGMVVQSDGKIVTAGPATGGGGRFSLVRYNTDGTRDSTFGSSGVVFTNFTSGRDPAYDLALQLDGKLVAAGKAAGGGGRFALARYNSNGSLDTTFSGDGKVATNFTAGNDYAYNVAVQSDGKIVAVGRGGGNGGRFAVARYNDDGSLDTSFSGDGKTLTNFTAGEDYADDVALGDTGTILVAGAANLGPRGTFALVRYASDGSLDTTFSGDGRLTTNFTNNLDGAWGVLIQPDDMIVAVGPAWSRMGIARYDSAGTLDSTFGPSGNGKVTTNFTSGLDWADEVVRDADARLVVVGVANVDGADPKFALARYTSAGALDTTFSGDGKLTTNLTRSLDYALEVQLTPVSGTIVVGGVAANGGRSGVARYLAE